MRQLGPKIGVENKTTSFEEVLLETIDERLSMLGESPKQSIYYHLRKTFKIDRQNIPYKIEEFADAIEKIFGAGAKIIEIQIMKCLFKKVGNNPKKYPEPKKNLTFTEYIAAARLSSRSGASN